MAAPLSYHDAREQLRREEFLPVYYLTGSQDVLKDDLVGEMVERVVDPAMRDFNVDIRSAGDLDGESLHALIETPPMMAERRLAVVRGLEQWRKNAKVWKVLDDYLRSPAPTTVVVLVHGADQEPDARLARRTTHVVVDPPREELVAWVGQRAERSGVRLSPEAADHLLEAVDGDLAQAAAEIEKLSAVVDGATSVDTSQLGELIGVRYGERTSDWVDAVLARDTVRALAMLEAVLGGPSVTAVRMVMELGTALLGTRLARALGERGARGRRLQSALFDWLGKTRPRAVGKWSIEVARWTRAAERWESWELDRAIRIAYETDRALKSPAVTDSAGLLTGMVLRMGARKAVA